MLQVCQLLAKAAPSDATVLLRGESGRGKELAARAIHLNSARHPFVAITAAVLCETLLESELFGHEKGAFTGAVAQKKGQLELADGGTVFLDEIGDVAMPLQIELLRLLQEREFTRVGGTHPIKMDVRFVAATHQDLDAAVKSGVFSQDLYYRLNVVTLRLAPLRERRDDIPLLATFFLAKVSTLCRRRVVGFSDEARDLSGALRPAGQRPRAGKRDRTCCRARVVRPHPRRRSFGKHPRAAASGAGPREGLSSGGPGDEGADRQRCAQECGRQLRGGRAAPWTPSEQTCGVSREASTSKTARRNDSCRV
jgi:hypothetical protein